MLGSPSAEGRAVRAVRPLETQSPYQCTRATAEVRNTHSATLIVRFACPGLSQGPPGIVQSTSNANTAVPRTLTLSAGLHTPICSNRGAHFACNSPLSWQIGTGRELCPGMLLLLAEAPSSSVE